MMDFSGSAGAASAFDTLPAGLIVFAYLDVKGVKSSASGGGYIDCELTVAENQPYAGRKVFEMIGDPQNPGNSEKYREMGTIAITRILEAGRGAGPNNLAGYQINSYEQLSGLKVAVKLKIEQGDNGHPDKNKVGEWLTPNPASQSGHKGWQRLIAGDHGLPQGGQTTQAPATGGFGGFAQTAAAPAQTTGGFGSAAPAGGAAPATGGFQQPAGDAPASSTISTTTSPSNPEATPGWLAQANG